MLNHTFSLCGDLGPYMEDADVDTKAKENVPVAGGGDTTGRHRLPRERILLTVRAFTKVYLMQFVMNTGKHL